jgi:peroxiredoxin
VNIDPQTGQDRGQIAFAQSLELHFPLLPDTGRNLSLLYGTVDNPQQSARRWSYLIDKDGILRFVDKEVQPRVRTHGSDILAKMRELGMAK